MNDITKDVRAEKDLLLEQRQQLIDKMLCYKAQYIAAEKRVHQIDIELQKVQ